MKVQLTTDLDAKTTMKAKEAFRVAGISSFALIETPEILFH